MENNLVVCGGTFDNFHKGHESFLKYVFSVGKRAIVGVTNDSFVKSDKRQAKSKKQIEPFKNRKQAVLEFVKRETVLDRVEIVEIDDLFGPSLSKDLDIDAIVVSENTKKGAEIINQKRQESGLKDLKILIAPFEMADDGGIISSGRIRKGEINREGKLYVNPLWLKTDLLLPENLRGELKKPLGVLFSEVKELKNLPESAATIGDITTKKFNESKLSQQISVIDFRVERQKKFSDIRELGFSGSEEIIKVDNPAGSITSDLFRTCLAIWSRGKVIILIEGEEDLAVLPLILTAPLGTVLFYGQPGEGIVKVEVSEEIKKVAYGLVNKFEMLKQVQHDK